MGWTFLFLKKHVLLGHTNVDSSPVSIFFGGLAFQFLREGVRWWTPDGGPVRHHIMPALFYLAMSMTVMIISCVAERLARPHLVRLVQQGKPFPDYLINRLLIWKQRKPQKLKQFIINITPTKGLHCNQSCKHAQSRS